MTTQLICKLEDIIPEGGVCALIEGKQVAIFRTKDDQLFALDNYDPFSKANVLSRGLIGGTFLEDTAEDGSTIKREVIYIASPIYKQRFDLATGQCLDDDGIKLNSHTIILKDNDVLICLKDSLAA
ncbi:nitrite reductase small subunit NirD [Psychrobacter lutiphocae]|uniref:nitrite reductase small subunit NirD n=1 Tax=Psychrobacter lutiphocae TaxID=540500 RepID=UPI00036DD7BE|nr:nitrite reductase small subunit NirD [Psychrobacter lutiphocae]